MVELFTFQLPCMTAECASLSVQNVSPTKLSNIFQRTTGPPFKSQVLDTLSHPTHCAYFHRVYFPESARRSLSKLPAPSVSRRHVTMSRNSIACFPGDGCWSSVGRRPEEVTELRRPLKGGAE